MKETWQKIYAPLTPDDETRVSIATQNRRGGSRKALLTKYILLSAIIGQVPTKDLGGLLAGNNILREDPLGEYADTGDRDNIHGKTVYDEVTRLNYYYVTARLDLLL